MRVPRKDNRVSAGKQLVNEGSRTVVGFPAGKSPPERHGIGRSERSVRHQKHMSASRCGFQNRNERRNVFCGEVAKAPQIVAISKSEHWEFHTPGINPKTNQLVREKRLDMAEIRRFGSLAANVVVPDHSQQRQPSRIGGTQHPHAVGQHPYVGRGVVAISLYEIAGLHHERRTATARQPAGSSYQQSVAAAPHLSVALEFLELYGDKKWTSMPTTHQHRS